MDFAALIEGYELMTPALRLRAKTRYMLQQVTTRAEHSDEQWTRFKFDPTQDDDHSAPFSAHDLQGHDPAAGKADVSHEVLICPTLHFYTKKLLPHLDHTMRSDPLRCRTKHWYIYSTSVCCTSGTAHLFSSRTVDIAKNAICLRFSMHP